MSFPTMSFRTTNCPDQELPDHELPFQMPPDHELPAASAAARSPMSNRVAEDVLLAAEYHAVPRQVILAAGCLRSSRCRSRAWSSAPRREAET